MVERVEEEEGDPTSAQAETSSSSWSSVEFSEARDSISRAVQGLLGVHSPSAAFSETRDSIVSDVQGLLGLSLRSLVGEMTGALNSAKSR
jgi:hypothetical protein